MLDNEAVFNVSRRRLDVKHQRVPVARADHYLVGLLLLQVTGSQTNWAIYPRIHFMLGVLVDIVPSINWAELMTFSRLAVPMASRQGRALRCCIVVFVGFLCGSF